jgi:hypothetical protein
MRQKEFWITKPCFAAQDIQNGNENSQIPNPEHVATHIAIDQLRYVQ